MKKAKFKKGKKEVPVFKAVIILVVAILFSIGITSIIYSFYKIIDYREFKIYVGVTDKNNMGFNLEPGVFNFGKVPQGASAKRNATVSHQYPSDIAVRIEIAGTVKDMVYVKDNYFILAPNATRQVEITASVPENKPLGNYSGTLRVYFERQ